MTARWRIATPRSRPAALAIIELSSATLHDLDTALARIAGAVPAVGAITLRPICGVDTGIIARLSPTHAALMPHGGPAVQDAIADALDDLGFERADQPTPREQFPEAESDLEAAMLVALARAPSPLAADLLLDQPRRWRNADPDRPATDRDRRLSRLIDPPVVAAVGPPNVGKSSLLNALVGRAAALVADEPGTTRDHIGATVDLAGLVVHWVDTPGRREAVGVEAQAIQSAEPVIRTADLVVAIGDGSSTDPRSVCPREPELVVAARSDVGPPAWRADLALSVRTGSGLEALVAAVRDALAPPADLESPEPWRFWGERTGGPLPSPQPRRVGRPTQ